MSRNPHASHRGWPTSHADALRQFAAYGEGDVFYAVMQKSRVPMLMADARQAGLPAVFVNPAFTQMTGYAATEVLGRNCNFLQGPATDEAAVLKLREALEWQREVAVELVNYRKDGSTFRNALFISPVYDRDGELLYYLGSQRDVTRRYTAAQNLAQADNVPALQRVTGEIAHDFNNLFQVMLGQLSLLTRSLNKDPIPGSKAQHHAQCVRLAVEQATELSQRLRELAHQEKQPSAMPPVTPSSPHH